MYSPIGYIIIGRLDKLENKERMKLQRRNISFHGNIIIMTYDDFLERAKNILELLLKNKNTEQNKA